MKKKDKKVLIFAGTSEIAQSLTDMLIKDGSEIFSVSRKKINNTNSAIKSYLADLSKYEDINNFFNSIKGEKFDSIICFQGVAISSPIEFLEREELQKQLDISLFSLLEILKHAKNSLNKSGTIINLSSMASFGIFPFLAPYSISKSSSDILLNVFEAETGIKTVSIKPGVIGTKFWKYCIKENENNFQKFERNYRQIGEFLKENALNNSTKGLKADKVAGLIYKIINMKNPKASYLIGADSYLASIASIFKGRFLSKLIQYVLQKRILRSKNAK